MYDSSISSLTSESRGGLTLLDIQSEGLGMECLVATSLGVEEREGDRGDRDQIGQVRDDGGTFLPRTLFDEILCS